MLTGVVSVASGATDDDWSACTSAGPFNLAPGDGVEVVFAMLVGGDLADLQANADAAAALYATVPTGVTEGPPPPRFSLLQNFPNPFNPSTTISFDVERSGPVRLEVFDLAGRKVRTLVDRRYEAGRHAVRWNGLDDAGAAVSSGVYLVRYESREGSAMKKAILVK
jgi:hypothetical protein